MPGPMRTERRLTSFGHGAGCGCKLGPQQLGEVLGTLSLPGVPPEVLVAADTGDDAAVYAHFTQAQRCWAHLRRKAIKLTLHEPHNLEYRQFTDELLAIYRAACRVQHDGRLSDAGRSRKIAALDEA